MPNAFWQTLLDPDHRSVPCWQTLSPSAPAARFPARTPGQTGPMPRVWCLSATRLDTTARALAAATVEAGSQRSARRKHFAQAMATMDKSIFPIMFGMFAGPETIPAHLVNDAVLDRIRAV